MPFKLPVMNSMIGLGGLVVSVLTFYYTFVVGPEKSNNTSAKDPNTTTNIPTSPPTNPFKKQTLIPPIPKPEPLQKWNIVSNSTEFKKYLEKKLISTLKKHAEYKSFQQVDAQIDLNKSKYKSGYREGFKYSLVIEITITSKANEICFSDKITNEQPLIGYENKSMGEIQNENIDPLFAEIENQILTTDINCK